MNLRKSGRLRHKNEMITETKTKIQKRKRTWKSSQMKRAIEMVNTGGSRMSEAARKYHIPLSTLASYLKQGTSMDLGESDSEDEQIDDLQSSENISGCLSDLVSDNGIETVSISSSNTVKTDGANGQKFFMVARKSTCPVKVIINKNFANNTSNIEEAPREKNKKDDFYHRDQSTDTTDFINSFIWNKNKLTNLSEFEKPIKIYSYLSIRQHFHPVFLNRNLSYLAKESNFKFGRRKKFKIDNICKIISYSDRQISFRPDSIFIQNKLDVDFFSQNIEKINESISIDICVTRPNHFVLIEKIDRKYVQVVMQNNQMIIKLMPNNFIPLKIDSFLNQNFKCLAFNVKILDKNFNFVYSLFDICDFFRNSALSSPSKTNFYDLTFRLKSDDTFKPFKSVQSLIDSFKESNLIQIKLKVLRTDQRKENHTKIQRLEKINSNVIYQFADKNNKKLITRTNSLRCPFCYLDHFLDYPTLVKHLNNSHFRIQVKQTIVSNGTHALKLDLSLDDAFDGSYSGSLHDLIKNSHQGFSRSRVFPTRQASIDSTEILVNKRSFNLNLDSLIKSENLTKDEIDSLRQIQEQLISVSSSIDQAAQLKNNFMQRVYYHARTSQPIHIDELDYDSDSEMDPEWLKELTVLLINDFADVNEGEKELMKMWSLHCLKHNFVADAQIYSACELFIDLNSQILIRKKLVNNFILHLANLNDHHLLKKNDIVKLINYLYLKSEQ